MEKKVTFSLLLPVILFAVVSCTTTQYHDSYYHDDFIHHDHYFHHDDFYYYPNIAVYFHIHSGKYYYRHDNHWVRSYQLPKKIHLDHRARRQLVIKDNKPFIHHHEHQLKFKDSKKFPGARKYDKPERERNRKIFERQKRLREREKH